MIPNGNKNGWKHGRYAAEARLSGDGCENYSRKVGPVGKN